MKRVKYDTRVDENFEDSLMTALTRKSRLKTEENIIWIVIMSLAVIMILAGLYIY